MSACEPGCLALPGIEETPDPGKVSSWSLLLRPKLPLAWSAGVGVGVGGMVSLALPGGFLEVKSS